MPNSLRLCTVCLSVLFLSITTTFLRASDAPVQLSEDAGSFTLDNGHVSVRIDKETGTFSMSYETVNVIGRGYWSQVGRTGAGSIARFGSRRSSSIRINPASNGGERAEVAVRLGYDPEAQADPKSQCLPCDVDIRYVLGRGDHGVYTYGVWEHKVGYPAFTVEEARTAYRLNGEVFDYLFIDAQRNMPMPRSADWDKGEPLNLKEVRRIKTGPLAGRIEHKYDYSAMLPQTPAYGWCSTSKHIGCWLINPSFEYLAGGPTKMELTGHIDVNKGGSCILLNMWHGSHYGGSSLAVAENESWTKVIGPFLLYCNSAPTPDRMWKDALAKAQVEQRAWPYAWMSDANYPPADQRGRASGRIILSDPQDPKASARNMWVGLAPARYEPADGTRTVDWQRDSKHYQFWTRADSQGSFNFANIRPGTYTLYAFADGVLGEFSKAAVSISPGQAVDLGQLTWTPAHFGRTLWEIGIPDRSAAEFRHGDHYWKWGLYNDYATEFPNDVNFIIGKSDWRTDWNYAQPPRIDGEKISPTTWSIRFDLPETPRAGKATLRLAIAGSRAEEGIQVSVNEKQTAGTSPLFETGTMHRDGIRGYWYERDVMFDATLLHTGENVIKLRIPVKNWTNGVLYDYLRLELDEPRDNAG